VFDIEEVDFLATAVTLNVFQENTAIFLRI
jgi:hypothetical protein